MTINISDNNPRISYSVSQGVTQSSFTVPFEFFDDDDLNVYVDGTLKTLTSDYTVSGGDGTTGTVTISVTGASGGSTVVITRDIELDRTTDFPSSGPFNINSLNTELDRLIAIAADLEDRAARAIQAQDFDSTVSYTLPLVDDRKGKVLGFNATTGAVEAGPEIADTQSLANVSADIALLADIEDGTLDTNAITNVNGIRTDVTTVSGISGNVTTVANNDANVTTVATNDANITTVASNIASVNTVATNIADVITVANDLNEAISEVETVANDLNESISEIETVAASITNVDLVGTDITNVNTTAGSISNVNTTATNIANVNTVAGISGNVTTVAGISSDVTTVAADQVDIGTVSTNIANVNTVAGISGNVTTVAGISSNVTTVANNDANVTTVAGINSAVSTVSGISADVTAVSNNNANVTTVAGSIANVNTAAADITNINTAATNISTINTVATAITDVSTVSGDIAAVITAANDLNEAVSEIDTVANAITNVDNVGNNITNVNTVAGISSDVTTVAGISQSDLSTVATNATNVGTVAGSISNVNTVATNINNVNDFFDVYRVGATDPTTSLDTGDLFYNTTSGSLKVYTGSAWEQGVTAGSGFLPLTGGQLTGNITMSGTETVDGRDLSVDGAKLDGIEAGATADQTKSDIDALGIAASTAATLATARNIALTGAVTGNVNFDGSGNVSIATTATSDPTLTLSGDVSGSATFTNLGNATLSVTVADDSHNHIISNVDGLQTALDGKYSTSGGTVSGNITATGYVYGGNYVQAPNMYVDNALLHSGDTDTYIQFGTDTIYLTSGGSTEVTITGTGVQLGDSGNGFFQPVSGDYGSIQIDGGGHNGWEGYNIGGHSVFMSNGSVTGIYNDVNNHWIVEGTHNGAASIYYAGNAKITTESGGASVTGLLKTEALWEDYDALSGTSVTIVPSNGGAFSLTMTGNTTFAFSSATSGYSVGFIVQLTGNGSTVTWPTSVDWAGGTAPDAPASGETDLLVFWTRDGGTTWYGMLAIDAAA